MEHHAYLIEGAQTQFEAYKLELKPFWAAQFERFGIDEARELITYATLKGAGERVFFVGAASMTSEAQQALLKLFEEPGKGITFVLLVPHGTLLPTLRSRMLEYPEKQKLAVQKPSAFLKANSKERSLEIAALLKDDESQKERVRAFLQGLEGELYKKINKSAQVRAGLEDIAKVRSYVADRSPSLKMLLEHLAVSLPKL